ncbi:MAG: molybdate ABC transporter substrate-binding protein [Syntrophomonadaceae bacterium]
MKVQSVLSPAFKRGFILIVALMMIMSTLAACSNKQKAANTQAQTTNLLVSLAPSLKTPMEELKVMYAGSKPDVQITFNYGPSGSLKTQIEQGAAADIFISQGKKEMDDLEQKNLLKAGTRKNLLSDELVLIVGKNNTDINSFEDLARPEIKKIGIGEAQTVPAARTAQQTLQTLKVWDQVQAKLVVGKDLMQITSWVEAGDADAGLVWNTIAMTSNKVRVAATALPSTHEPVVLPAAVIGSSKNSAAAEDFLTFLQSDQAMQVFAKYGFEKAK